jgi:hypothetical protein
MKNLIITQKELAQAKANLSPSEFAELTYQQFMDPTAEFYVINRWQARCEWVFNEPHPEEEMDSWEND